ncbi:MAG TPA: GDP-mannose 4,6-dehydratase [Actinomycetota bacterium]|nr:GDP-mannose 4,6-dehydratase [Actinomycetota bacterium]
MGASYLITGGAGFIGSHLADALVARGDRVVLLDDLSTGRFDNIAHIAERPEVRFVEGSILDEDVVRALVGEVDIVVHLAAAVGVHLIVQRPLDSLITNIHGTEVVLGACADAGRKVLLASTSEIYGKNGEGPLHEESDRIIGHPFKARWSYSTSKAVDEILAQAYHRERGLPSIVVRLFNTVGPRQTGAYGMVVPRFVRQALREEDVTVYGEGDQRRCFCHVEDTVAALTSLLDHPDAVGSVFNVGSEHEVTINELAALVVHMTGSTSRIVHVPYDVAYEEGFEDMERRFPDVSRIARLTGWRPRRSLGRILTDVIAYERERLGVGERL